MPEEWTGLPEAWTGEVVGKMHNNKISNSEMAEELNLTPQYVSMVLNGAKNPSNAKERFTAAVDAIIKRRKEIAT